MAINRARHATQTDVLRIESFDLSLSVRITAVT